MVAAARGAGRSEGGLNVPERRIVVVGASAAGLSCACRIARLEPSWPVTVVEARDVFSFSACGMPYVLSGDIEQPSLIRSTGSGRLRDASYFAAEKGVTVLDGWRVTAVDAQRRAVLMESPGGEETRRLEWDDLVLATGAHARRIPDQPEHPRVHAFHVWDDLIPLFKSLQRGGLERIAIVGAGLVGCELADAFRGLWGLDVVLLERGAAPLPRLLDPELGRLVANHLVDEMGVGLRTSFHVDAIEPDDDAVTLLDKKGETLRVDAVVVAAGVEPAVELAHSAGVALGGSGAISVSEQMATTVPRVWAIGDCVEVRLAATGGVAHMPAGSLAQRQGRVLANVLCGRQDRFQPVAGAIVLKTDELNIGAVGINATTADAERVAHRSVWLTASDRAHYWPESELLHMKMIYDPLTRRVLGVQAVGRGDVSKRVDVATQLIIRHATIEDFAHIEHGYAPPFSPATEPLSLLARLAQNQEEGILALPPDAELDDAYLVDLRGEKDREALPFDTGHVEGGDMGALRDDSTPLSGRNCVMLCGHGSRAAQAVCFLRERGVDARYLGGGTSWRRGIAGKR